jgi:hypothetical protein
MGRARPPPESSHPGAHRQVIDSGNWARVPVLLGTNTNEGETFIYDAVDFPLPGFLINLALDVVFDPAASAQITQQPRYLTNVSDGRTPLSNVLTDYWCDPLGGGARGGRKERCPPVRASFRNGPYRHTECRHCCLCPQAAILSSAPPAHARRQRSHR